MKNKINTSIILLLLLIGFFFPTSVDGVISTKLVLLHTYILITLLLIVLIINRMHKANLIIAFLINVILLVATLIHLLFTDGNELNRISWGGYLPLLSLSLLYPISFLDIKYSSVLKKFFVILNLFNIIVGFLIVYDFPAVKSFFMEHYSMGYAELVFTMLLNNKPVNMFGSHAIASNFFFLLFYISFQTFIHTKKKFYFMLAIADLLLIANLKSVSAYLLLVLSVIQIFFYLQKKYRFFKAMSLPLALAAVMYFVYNPPENVQAAFTSQNNGFLGRYSSDGAFAATVDYISQNLLPIGLWYSDDLFFTDSGFMVSFLKGSIFLVIAVYLGLFLLLRRNIKNKRVAYTLFGIICLFELGYTTLTFNRMVSFLPFVLIYLNHLEKEKQLNIKVN